LDRKSREEHQGGCLCGAINFHVAGPLSPPVECHCSMCRKMSGHSWASTDVLREALTISGEENLRWFRSSEKVRRGFCGICGSTMFWDPVYKETIAISMGAFDGASHTKLRQHIYVASKGDYYEICDGLPQNAE
jgi:hypothetical protein